VTAQTNNKVWKSTISPGSHLSIVDPYYVRDAKPRLGSSFGLYFSRENNDKPYFFSYGIALEGNRYFKEGFVDNRIDPESPVSEVQNNRSFSTTFAYTYLAPAINFNYKLSNKQGGLLGITAGLALKYYLRYTTIYQLNDGDRKTALGASDFEANYLGNNAAFNIGIWRQLTLSERWVLRPSFFYAYDLNFLSSVPRFHRFGLTVGVTRVWIKEKG
jgi:hypothetical protein